MTIRARGLSKSLFVLLIMGYGQSIKRTHYRHQSFHLSCMHKQLVRALRRVEFSCPDNIWDLFFCHVLVILFLTVWHILLTCPTQCACLVQWWNTHVTGMGLNNVNKPDIFYIRFKHKSFILYSPFTNLITIVYIANICFWKY